MRGGVVNLLEIEIGQAARLRFVGGGEALGYVTAQLGDPFRGVYPRLELTTPGGSRFVAGRAWFSPIGEALPMLREYQDLQYPMYRRMFHHG